MLKVSAIILTSLALVVMGGCGDKGEKIADVNGKTITKQQFDAYLKFKHITAKDDKKRDALLNQYLEREALAAVIEKSKLLDKAMIEAELNEFKKQMLISRYFDKYLKEKVSDVAVKNYYASNAAKYQERKVHVAHILIRTNRKMGEAERKAKLTTAQEAYSKIKSGESFEKVAKEYSEDAISAKKGGDLGWLKEGSIDKKFSDTVFNMKPGDISEPFETPFGFHIVKLIEGPTVTQRPFDAVKGDIRYQLRNQAKAAELKRLTSEAKITRD